VCPEDSAPLIEFILNTLLAGIFLGGFYTLISLGLSISFGLINMSNIAHPTFALVGGYFAYILHTALGIDPIISGVISLPLFFIIGVLLYRAYNVVIEKRGHEKGLISLVFLFSLLILMEVGLLLVLGADWRSVYTPYMVQSIKVGILNVPLRMFIPFVIAVIADIFFYYLFSKTFFGLGVRAIAQNPSAAMLMGYNPLRINMLALGISVASASLGGSLLLMIQPIQPFSDRPFIGRVFAVVVLGGMGSLYGTVVASIILGVVEAVVAAFFGASWSMLMSFAILLVTLILKPEGLFRR